MQVDATVKLQFTSIKPSYHRFSLILVRDSLNFIFIPFVSHLSVVCYLLKSSNHLPVSFPSPSLHRFTQSSFLHPVSFLHPSFSSLLHFSAIFFPSSTLLSPALTFHRASISSSTSFNRVSRFHSHLELNPKLLAE